jgi:ribosome-associated protein
MTVKLSGVRKINITGEYIKLDALLKYAAFVSSGGEAKDIIRKGKIYIGGKPCIICGKKVRPDEVVRYGRDTLLVKQQ